MKLNLAKWNIRERFCSRLPACRWNFIKISRRRTSWDWDDPSKNSLAIIEFDNKLGWFGSISPLTVQSHCSVSVAALWVVLQCEWCFSVSVSAVWGLLKCEWCCSVKGADLWLFPQCYGCCTVSGVTMCKWCCSVNGAAVWVLLQSDGCWSVSGVAVWREGTAVLALLLRKWCSCVSGFGLLSQPNSTST